MARNYGVLQSVIWQSETIRNLSDSGLIFAVYLMTCSHGTIAGVFRLPPGYISEDLGPKWGPGRIAEAFAELEREGFASRCTATQWVWIRNHLKWNRPENPNQRKAASKIALSIPDGCSWRGDFLRQSGRDLGLELPDPVTPVISEGAASAADCDNLSQTAVTISHNHVAAEPLFNSSGTVSKPVTVTVPVSITGTGTGTGTGTEESPSGDLSPASPATHPVDGPKAGKPEAGAPAAGDLLGDGEIPPGPPPCPVKRLLAQFVTRCPSLPRPRPELFSESAAADAMRQRWKWLLSAKREDDGTRYATTAAEGLAWFDAFFENVEASDFLTGRSNGAKFDLAWLMKAANFMKVVQGNFENKKLPSRRPGSSIMSRRLPS